MINESSSFTVDMALNNGPWQGKWTRDSGLAFDGDTLSDVKQRCEAHCLHFLHWALEHFTKDGYTTRACSACEPASRELAHDDARVPLVVPLGQSAATANKKDQSARISLLAQVHGHGLRSRRRVLGRRAGVHRLPSLRAIVATATYTANVRQRRCTVPRQRVYSSQRLGVYVLGRLLRKP